MSVCEMCQERPFPEALGFQGDHLVTNITGYAKYIPRPESLFLAADDEGRAAFEDDAHLLVRMAMLFNHGVRLKFRQRQHHFLGGAGSNGNAGEDRMRG